MSVASVIYAAGGVLLLCALGVLWVGQRSKRRYGRFDYSARLLFWWLGGVGAGVIALHELEGALPDAAWNALMRGAATRSILSVMGGFCGALSGEVAANAIAASTNSAPATGKERKGFENDDFQIVPRPAKGF